MITPFKIIAARFSRSDAVLLKKICKARGEDLSDFLRRSVRKEFARLSYLSDDEKKALEVKSDNSTGENDLKVKK